MFGELERFFARAAASSHVLLLDATPREPLGRVQALVQVLGRRAASPAAPPKGSSETVRDIVRAVPTSLFTRFGAELTLRSSLLCRTFTAQSLPLLFPRAS